jgi:F0F1-type ATP synthase assembly protein I
VESPGGKNKPGASSKRWTLEVGPYFTIGMQLAVAVVAFFFLGQWLDGKFGTSPWLMITGAAVGAVGGMISFLRTAISLGKKEDEKMRSTHDERDENR